MSELHSICEKLKKYTLDSKIRASFMLSQNIMSLDGIHKRYNHTSTTFAWNIETFLVLSICNNCEEADQDLFNYNNIQELFIIFDLINSLMNLKIKSVKDFSYPDIMMPFLGTLEFKSQENGMYLLYRSKYFFNFENSDFSMKSIFHEKLEDSFEMYNEFVLFLNVCLGIDKDNERIITYLYVKYRKQLEKLTTHVKDINDFVKSIKSVDILNSVKIIWMKPYVNTGSGIILPIPHLLYRSITDAMLFRLTEGDNNTRTMFGKYCLESYVKHLLTISGQYKEVHDEIVYKTPKGNKNSSDVMARCGNIITFFETKAFVPGMNIRHLDVNTIRQSIETIGRAVVQIYIQLKYEFGTNYNPFSIGASEIENKYGLVVLLEDSFVSRKRVYKSAQSILELDGYVVDEDFLMNNIKVVGLYQIESSVFEGTNISKVINKSKKDNKPNDFISLSNPSGKYTKPFTKFKREQIGLIDDLKNELVDKNIIRPY